MMGVSGEIMFRMPLNKNHGLKQQP